ncbi:MAG TPA: OsmC family protein [Jatrophihabitans sp.]|nr:OsmC family protein [Jatrophihabitans sp.]
MSNPMSVRHLDGDQFAIDVRGHSVIVDQPVADGGLDEAPTPTELFLAGLAGCVAFYARRYLARHELSAEGLTVTLDYSMGSRPARVSDVRVVLTPPRSLPAERRDAFLAVASHCTVHNSLSQPPAVEIALDPAAAS